MGSRGGVIEYEHGDGPEPLKRPKISTNFKQPNKSVEVRPRFTGVSVRRTFEWGSPATVPTALSLQTTLETSEYFSPENP